MSQVAKKKPGRPPRQQIAADALRNLGNNRISGICQCGSELILVTEFNMFVLRDGVFEPIDQAFG